MSSVWHTAEVDAVLFLLSITLFPACVSHMSKTTGGGISALRPVAVCGRFRAVKTFPAAADEHVFSRTHRRFLSEMRRRKKNKCKKKRKKSAEWGRCYITGSVTPPLLLLLTPLPPSPAFLFLLSIFQGRSRASSPLPPLLLLHPLKVSLFVCLSLLSCQRFVGWQKGGRGRNNNNTKQITQAKKKKIARQRRGARLHSAAILVSLLHQLRRRL